MELYFISGNQGKIQEVQEVLPNIKNIDLDLPELQEIDPMHIIAEKLKVATKEIQGQFIVEDTSLYLDCINGLPGPLIKWFLQSLGNEGIYELISNYGNSNAIAKSIIGYYDGKEMHFFVGEMKGTIVQPKGDAGFGWDKIFMPEGYDKTFAELAAENRKPSMRKIALHKLKDFISKI